MIRCIRTARALLVICSLMCTYSSVTMNNTQSDSPALIFSCPVSSCWCADTYQRKEVQLTADLHYRTAYNKVLKQNQTLYLDVWSVPPSASQPTSAASKRALKPGALVIHGGGYSSGPFNGCSHAKNMTQVSEVAITLAVRGFVVISIDYRCEGSLRRVNDYHTPWYDAVEDARAAVLWMQSHKDDLQLDPSRIMAFGGSAGAVTVAEMLYMNASSSIAGKNDNWNSANITCGISLSGAIIPESIAHGRHTASPQSPQYLDIHGTNDATVPYDYALAHGNNKTWGDATDTKAWLDSQHAPNYLAPIPGAGHVPFGSIPPCAAPEQFGCWNSTFFGFLFRAMDLANARCPFPSETSSTLEWI